MQLSDRQRQIVEIVKSKGPITGEQIAKHLNLTRATLRPDLAILTMSGILEARPRVGYFYSGKPAETLIADAVRRILVKDVKSVPVVVRDNTSAYDCIVTMFTEDVGTLFVVSDGGVLVGVVSRKDLLRTAVGQGDLHKIPVGMLMTRMPNIITTTNEETVYEAARKMIEHEVDALPVVRPKEGRAEQLEVIGRLTKTNITRLFVELGEGNY
ncbi:MAG TPA: helix-turn-helix transcriptional regulator [Clostridia bacterium]|nr:helix-turn-helix transcriptional regulator [Clostridia bacterium]